MASLLVMLRDKPVSPSRVAGGRIVSVPKAGDVIAVKPDGWVWGTGESKAAWIAAGNDPAKYPGLTGVVDLPGVPVEKIKALLAPHRAGNAPSSGERRLWKLDLNALSPKDRGDLNSGAPLSLTDRKFEGVTVNKDTGDPFVITRV